MAYSRETIRAEKARRAAAVEEPYDEAYAEFVRDRDVVVVGPSGGYLGTGSGLTIDAFDLVARLNWGSPVPPEHRGDLGSRTDILYKRLLQTALPTSEDAEAWAAEGVRAVAVSAASAQDNNARHFEAVTGGRFLVTLAGAVRGEIRAASGTSPLMGVMAVTHLLKYPVRSVTMMNCDFYAGGYQPGYGGREYRESRGRVEGTVASVHDVPRQLRYLYRLQLADSRLHFDARLSDLVADAVRDDAARDAIAVIPARYGSSRFPGKPLADIAGRAMVLHVCDRVSVVIPNLVVATDDDRIARCVEDAGYRAVMTGDALTGTDRVAEAVAGVQAGVVVNVQGDEPLIAPLDVLRVLEAKRRHPRGVVNGIAPLSGGLEDRSVVKAVVSADGRLLYATRAPVPTAWRQMGLYAFSTDDLRAFRRRGARAPLEAAEDVEILRFVEMGTPVYAQQCAGTHPAVDLPEHVMTIESLMREVVPA